MSQPSWSCWACKATLDGPTYQTIDIRERWKGQFDREGNVLQVVLCLECSRRVRETLYAIQEQRTRPDGAEQEASDG